MPPPKKAITDPVLRSYLRARRVPGVSIAVIGIAALSVAIGTWPSRFPTMSSSPAAQVPFWRMLVIVVAVLPIIALHSSLADLEIVATRAFRIRQRRYLVAAAAISVASYLAICASVFPTPVIAIMFRGWFGWFGLALLAGALLGWRLAWTVPVCTGIVFWYWGFDSNSQQFHWWEFSARPVLDLPSLLLAVGLVLVGAAAYAATPWRRRQLLRRRQFD